VLLRGGARLRIPAAGLTKQAETVQRMSPVPDRGRSVPRTRLHAARPRGRRRSEPRCAMRSTRSWPTTPPHSGERASESLLRCAQSTRRSPDVLRRPHTILSTERRQRSEAPQWWRHPSEGVPVVVLPAGHSTERRRIAVRRAATVTNGPSGLAIDHRSLQAGSACASASDTNDFVVGRAAVKIGRIQSDGYSAVFARRIPGRPKTQ